MQENDKTQAIFGAFDGLTSGLGVLIALLLQHQGQIHLFNIVLGLAVSSGLSMGYGEWLADGEGVERRAFVIGGATGLGTFIPALPFILLHGFFAYAFSLIGMYLTCMYVGRLRGRDPKLTREVFYGVLLVTVLVVICEWVTGGIA